METQTAPSAAPRQLPALTADNEFFWRSGRDGVLRILRCDACRYWIHPPGPVCPQCLGRGVSPEPVIGAGTVAAYTVNYQQWQPGLEVPFVVALVELPEQAGLRLTTNIVECDPHSVVIGMPVDVTFVEAEDVWLPLFRPVQ